jgi:hypothetical protein
MELQLDPRPLDEVDWFVYFRDVYLGFGSPEGLVRRCVNRAYLDFNRTWHGAQDPAGQRRERREAAETAIVEALNAIADRDIDQAAFDEWHRNTRNAVIHASDPAERGSGLTLGQAQKWINMSAKYVVGSRAPGLAGLEVVAHVPIDGILLTALERHCKFAPALKLLPAVAWSKLSDEQAYEKFQCEVRRLAAPLPPLVLEFRLWFAERTPRPS